MTAEIGVLNMRGVALAADSAVTIGNAKVMNNARKLFTLDSQHSVGIMIYGNATIMGVPWEVLITLFRKDVSDKVPASLDRYGELFFKFIQDSNIFDKSVLTNEAVYNYGSDILSVIQDEIQPFVENTDVVDRVLSKIKKINVKNDHQNKNLMNIEFDEFKSSYTPAILDLFNSQQATATYRDETVIDAFTNKLFELIISDNYYSTSQTGIVFAGYGLEDYFPGIQQFTVDGFVCRKLKYVKQKENFVGAHADNISSAIEPFAQQEMVHTVLKGIDPKLDEIREEQLNQIQKSIVEKINLQGEQQTLVTKIIEENKNYFQNFQRQNYINPMLNMLNILSVDELATMAKTLVSLTSFKRKFSGSMETVGGPIDVLVISKGEGPVWIDRKKYFDIDMNEGYLKRRK